jgi:WD40 repeat protein
VFVSYSREDAEWRRRFVEMLEPVMGDRGYEVWSDDRGLVGEKWRPQLAEAISRSVVALLLVSPPFLASQFIMKEELPALTEHGTILAHALVRPCLWDQVKVLAEVQSAHDPRRDGPLSTKDDQEGGIVLVCQRLLGLLPPRANQDLPVVPIDRPGASIYLPSPVKAVGDGVRDIRENDAPATEIAAGIRPGELHDVPPLPRGFVAREELAGLRQAVLRRSAVGITGEALGLHGQGGIGKTVLAAAVARDDSVRRHFPDGIFWVTVGERGDLVGAQIELLGALGASAAEPRSAAEGADLLRAALADRQCLLVVDDVWSTAAAQAFATTGPRGRILYTTRDERVVRSVGADVRPVDVLPAQAARDLLAGLTGVEPADLPDDVDRVLQATGRVALALALAGAAVGRGGRDWHDVAEQLERAGSTFLDHPYANTFKAMQVAVAALDKELAGAYAALAVYPEDALVPIRTVALYWSSSEEAARELLESLAGRRLLSLTGDAITFHDLQRDFLLLRVADLTVLHDDLLSAFRRLLPTTAGAWRDLPEAEPYVWDHLFYHLRGAGDAAGMLDLASDLAYLARRAFHSGPHAAEADLRQALELYPEDVVVGRLLRGFAQWGHLLAGHVSVGELAATFASRTTELASSSGPAPLAELLPARFLRVRWGLPSSPTALIRVLDGHHAQWVTAVSFSPQGHLLASSGDDGWVQIWDVATGKPTRALDPASGALSSAAFSPDGHALASGSTTGSVRLWDLASGASILTLEGHAHAVTKLAFSPDGCLIASAGRDPTAIVWDVATGEACATIQNSGESVTGLAFSGDGAVLATSSEGRGGGSVILSAAAGGDRIGTVYRANAGAVQFSPDGQFLAVAGWDKAALRHGNGELVTTLVGDDWVTAVSFAPDGSRVAGGTWNGFVRVWNAETGEIVVTHVGHTDWISGIAFSPDGSVIATSSHDGTVMLWNAWSAELETPRIDGHRAEVSGVAFSPDGEVLASSGHDGRLQVWSTTTGQATSIDLGTGGLLMGVAMAPIGTAIACAGYSGVVWLVNYLSGEPAKILEGHASVVTAVAFSPNGRVLASASDDRTVRLWDATTGEPTCALHGHTGRVAGVAFSPDGRVLASCSHDGTVRVWDATTAKAVARLSTDGGHFTGVAISSDGRTLATSGGDHAVRLWDIPAGKLTAVLEGHAAWVHGVAFSPDGRFLMSCSDDGTARAWDIETSVELCKLRLGRAAHAVAWASDAIAVACHTNVILRTRSGLQGPGCWIRRRASRRVEAWGLVGR